MKKFIFIIFFSAILTFSYGQITLLDTAGNAITETVIVENGVQFDFVIKNNSDSTIHYLVKADSVSLLDGAVWEVCANGSCVTVERPVQIGVVQELAPGATDELPHVIYIMSKAPLENSFLRLAVMNPYNPSDSAVINFEGTTSNTYLTENQPKKIYPSITSGNLFFNFDADLCEIADLSGKIYLSREIRGKRSIDVSSLQTGVYIIRFLTNTQVYTYKFVKK